MSSAASHEITVTPLHQNNNNANGRFEKPTTTPATPTMTSKRKPGEEWKRTEVHEIPH
ncbi:hypothetical protein FRC17_006488, partial [Serendipita sp. 399]